jgi:hypothetical protein
LTRPGFYPVLIYNSAIVESGREQKELRLPNDAIKTNALSASRLAKWVDNHGHLWAARLYLLDDKGNVEVRDYTNVASDKDVRRSCRGDAVPVHMMP